MRDGTCPLVDASEVLRDGHLGSTDFEARHIDEDILYTIKVGKCPALDQDPVNVDAGTGSRARDNMLATFSTAKAAIALLDIFDQITIFIEPRGIRLKNSIPTAWSLALVTGVCLIGVITIITGLIVGMIAQKTGSNDPVSAASAAAARLEVGR